MLAGTREAFVRRRTQLSNTIRSYAAEFGLVSSRGLDKIEPLLARIAADDDLPTLAKEMFADLGRTMPFCRSGSRSSRGSCASGIAMTNRADGWQRYRASVWSGLLCWR